MRPDLGESVCDVLRGSFDLYFTHPFEKGLFSDFRKGRKLPTQVPHLILKSFFSEGAENSGLSVMISHLGRMALRLIFRI